jgi:Tfp pilus assembly protein FimV
MAALALMLGAGGWWTHRRRLHKRQNTDSTGTWSDIPFDETASDEDPLTQADQLIQAGQLEAAETHLKNALRNNPALLTAQAKLLEVYALRLHGSGLQGWHNEQVSPQQPDFKDFDGEPYEDDAPLGSGLPHGFQELPSISLDLNDDGPSR